MKFSHTILLLSLTVAISACDDDKKNKQLTSKSSNGIYSGSISGGNAGFNGNERAIVFNNKLIVLSTVNSITQVFDTDITLNDTKNNRLAGTAEYFNISTSTPALMTFSGRFDSGKTLNGTFTDSSNAPAISPATISLTLNKSLYEKKANKSITKGIWSGTYGSSANTMTITVDSDGIFTGSDTETCQYTGTIKPASSQYNVYNVTLNNNVNIGCVSLADNNYTGLAWIEGNNNNSLVFSVSNGNNNRTIIFNKQ